MVGSWQRSSSQTGFPSCLQAPTFVSVSPSWSFCGCGSVACSPFLLTFAAALSTLMFNLLPPPPLPSPFTHSLSLPLPVSLSLSVWSWNRDPKASVEQQQDTEPGHPTPPPQTCRTQRLPPPRPPSPPLAPTSRQTWTNGRYKIHSLSPNFVSSGSFRRMWQEWYDEMSSEIKPFWASSSEMHAQPRDG